MLKFISFGSGSSGNCYYLSTEKDGLLIDIGVGMRSLKKRFQEYGLSLHNIHHVLITHDHADHIKSVGSISGDYHLPVYATEKVHKGITGNYCIHRNIQSEYVRYIEKGETVQLGDFKVTSFDVPHDSSENVGYQIECEGIVFCLMTDVGHVTEEMLQYISTANYLILEANYDEEMLRTGNYPPHLKVRIEGPSGHLSNKCCGEALVSAATPALRHVWLCHLSEENNHPELARKTVEQVLRSHGIIVGADFQLDVLKRKVPSGICELV